MSFETDLWDAVTGNAELAALIGTRLYRNRVEDDPTSPYVVVFQVHGRPSQAFPGNVVTDTNVLQFRIMATDEDTSVSVRDALRTALVSSGYPIFFEDDQSGTDMISSLYRRDMTVRVSHG
jgi:hypothetical protein